MSSLPQVRQEAMERFEALGLPTVANEAWRYADLHSLRKGDFKTIETDDIDDDRIEYPAYPGVVLVVVNGEFTPSLSRLETVDGLNIAPLADALAAEPSLADRLVADDGRAFTALNTASFRNGLVIKVSKPIADPVTVLYVTSSTVTDAVIHPRLFVDVAPHAELLLVEMFRGEEDLSYWVNPVRDFVIGTNAGLKAITVYDEGPAALNTAHLKLSQKRDSRFEHRAMCFGGKFIRHEVHAHLEEPGVECNLLGAALAAAGQTFDIYTEMHHRAPHGRSNQLFRSVADAKGKTAYQGRIVVHEGAQKTDAVQSSRNLLLDKSAEANTKPELEIYADDVKCAHGATVGALDEAMLFYLESRGIDPVTAKTILIEAFVGGVIDDLPLADLEQPLRDHVSGWMSGRARLGEIA